MATRRYNAREITIRLERETMDEFGKDAFAILRNLIQASPVGDPTRWMNPASAPPGYVGGHFRRNWLVSIGGFTNVEIPGIDANGATTIADGKSKIDSFVRRGKPGPTVVIQNNVPYANRLAQGHSTQRKAGWVDRSIDAALTFTGGTKDLG
jgi:hypothetical protein